MRCEFSTHAKQKQKQKTREEQQRYTAVFVVRERDFRLRLHSAAWLIKFFFQIFVANFRRSSSSLLIRFHSQKIPINQWLTW